MYPHSPHTHSSFKQAVPTRSYRTTTGGDRRRVGCSLSCVRSFSVGGEGGERRGEDEPQQQQQPSSTSRDGTSKRVRVTYLYIYSSHGTDEDRQGFLGARGSGWQGLAKKRCEGGKKKEGGGIWTPTTKQQKSKLTHAFIHPNILQLVPRKQASPTRGAAGGGADRGRGRGGESGWGEGFCGNEGRNGEREGVLCVGACINSSSSSSRRTIWP